MLTRKQHELLTYIDGFIRSTGCSPSFDEMKDALQLRSKSGIHRLISALEERGFLQRRHNRARALEVIRLPNQPALLAPVGADLPGDADAQSFRPNVIRGGFTSRLPGVRAAEDAAAVQIPLYGRIAAGLPIEALRDDGAQIEVPVAWLGSGEHFALEVAGDSMIRGRHPERRHGHHPQGRDRRDRRDRGRTRRRERSDAEAHPPPRQLDRARARQCPARDADLPANRVKVQGRLVALMRKY